MNSEHLLEVKNKSKDFLELYRIIAEFYVSYKRILDRHVTDDEINSNNNLKESVSSIFKKIDDINFNIDIITHFVVR